MSVSIRDEEQRDWAQVRTVNTAAFETPVEADLVDALRQLAAPLVSLVAEEGQTIIGHIMFSPGDLPGRSDLKIMGLGPMAVAPSSQRRGIGSALVRAGLEECRELGIGAVVVLGHPTYYPRFGFAPAKPFGLGCEYEAPDEAFMVIELTPGYLRGVTGRVKYHAVFSTE